MEISYNDLKTKEIINLNDGVKMGHVVDAIFDSENGKVLGFIVPGEKRFFKKNEDVFIPLEKVRRVGDDVILVRVDTGLAYKNKIPAAKNDKNVKSAKYFSQNNQGNSSSFIRYRKLENKKYK